MSAARWILAATITFSLSACSGSHQNDAASAHAASAAATQPSAPAASASTASATKQAIGIDLAGIDHAVVPGNDFFKYTNGEWLTNAKIPADRSSIGTFYQVAKLTQKHTAELITDAGKDHPAAGSNQRKIADYYAAYMNTDAIAKAGLTPLKSRLGAIHAIASRNDLARVLGSRLRADTDPINATNFHTDHLFGLFVTKGLHSHTNMAYLLQGGLSMPGRDYYLSNDTAMVKFRDGYKTYVAGMLKQARVAHADAAAKAVVDLETKIAKAQETLIDSQDVHKGDNVWSIADFTKKAPGLNWSAYFKAAGLSGQKHIDVWQPSATSKLSALVKSQPLSAWKALLTFHTLDRNAALLPTAFADLHFGFHDKTLQGTPQQQPRWKRAVDATSESLGDAVGKIYVSKYFPAASKKQVQQLVSNLIAAFGDRIDTLAWMAPQTKLKAKAKLTTLRVSVGYPETWRDYASLDVSPDDALGNHLRAEQFEYAYQKSKLGQPIDKAEWWMTPQLVNAINLPLQNALNFPAAILQPPFFKPHADAASNYGAIGAVIGHEISHSFDNMGSQFDAQGDLNNWWTPADAAHFTAATARLAKQYSAYEPLPGVHVNGERTLGEDIADISGLTVALDAYHKSLGGKPAPVIDGLTGDQRFFLAFGQTWRTKARDAALRQSLNTNVRAPASTRAQTVRNLDAWYKAFDVKPRQKLYLTPANRVRIW